MSLLGASSPSLSSSEDERHRTLELFKSAFLNVLLLLFFDLNPLLTAESSREVDLRVFEESDLRFGLGKAQVFGDKYVSLLQPPTEPLDDIFRNAVSVDLGPGARVFLGLCELKTDGPDCADLIDLRLLAS
jgi:hypothetical protein